MVGSLSSTDPDHDELRLIKRGEKQIDPVFDQFVAEFQQAFGIVPLALATDLLPATRVTNARPRLGVVLERTAEQLAFRSPDTVNYDQAKQADVARIVARSVPATDLSRLFGVAAEPDVDWAADLFVHFTEFESTAKSTAHASIRGAELDRFVAGLGLGDQFWCTQRYSGPPVVFVHTDAQAAVLRDSEMLERWADLYFALVKAHDEFGYLSRDEIVIRVDSKETFDRDYQSSSYYYFK